MSCEIFVVAMGCRHVGGAAWRKYWGRVLDSHGAKALVELKAQCSFNLVGHNATVYVQWLIKLSSSFPFHGFLLPMTLAVGMGY